MPAPPLAENPSPGRLAHLDGLRGVAILSVLAGHFAPYPLFNTGRFGVELFLVLGGRLMADLLFVRRTNLGRFVLRRFSRVWPALALFLLAMSVAFAGPGPLHVQPADLQSVATLTANYRRLMTGDLGVLDHLWSLCVEEWSYVVLLIAALLYRRTRTDPILLLGLLTLVCVLNGFVRWGHNLDYYATYWRTDVRMASMLMGALAYLFAAGDRRPWSPLLVGIIGAVGVVANLGVVPDPIKYTLGTACLAILVARLDRMPFGVLRALSYPPLRMIGLWSFSLYLWQQPFFRLTGRAPVAVLLGATVLTALASYHLCEKPCRRWLNDLADGAGRRTPRADLPNSARA